MIRIALACFSASLPWCAALAQSSPGDCNRQRQVDNKACYEAVNGLSQACLDDATNNYGRCIAIYNSQNGGPVAPSAACSLPGVHHGDSLPQKNGRFILCP